MVSWGTSKSAAGQAGNAVEKTVFSRPFPVSVSKVVEKRQIKKLENTAHKSGYIDKF